MYAVAINRGKMIFFKKKTLKKVKTCPRVSKGDFFSVVDLLHGVFKQFTTFIGYPVVS